MSEIRSLYFPSREANTRNHFIDRAVREQFPLGNVSEPLTALGLVHVMRGDQKRQPLRCELMNFFPEIAPRFWIDPGRRLVQQQQFRTMNETGSEREPLFPS